MRRTALLIATGALCASSAANASLLSIELRAQVATFCAITAMRPVNLAEGKLSIGLVCNSENFLLELGGDLQGLPLQSAHANDALSTAVGFQSSVAE